MATAEEILAAAFASEAITVNVETRELIIPSTLDSIGVESDDDVFKIPFILPRFYGDIDFRDFDININYLNAQGNGDVYDVVDAVVNEDTIEFSWLVGRYAAAYAGNVTFNLCLKKYNKDDPSIVDKEWNSIPAIVTVEKGLETTEAIVDEQPEVIAKLCGYINGLNVRITRLEKLVGLGEQYGNSKIQFIDGVIIISPGGPKPEDIECLCGCNCGSEGSGGSGDSSGNGSGSNTDIPSGGGSDSGTDEPGGSSGGTEKPSEPEEVISYNLFGKWVFNTSISFPGVAVSLTNNAMKTGANFGISVTKMSVSAGTGVSYVISGSKKTVAGSDGAWTEGGYRYIDFGADGVKVDELFYNWFVDNATVHVDEEVGETYRLYITGGYGVSIYTNGSDAAPLHVTADTVECRGVHKFKFTTDNVDFYFKSGAASDTNSEIISLEMDANGWYKLEQDTTVVVTAGGENSRRVNNYLTNATTTNTAKSVMLDSPYKAHIAPLSGYYIDSVAVVMNGSDVTNEVYANGDINIPAVTGDISISVVAVAFIGDKYQVDVASAVASYVYINLDEATPIAINVGVTTLNGVAKLKLAGANISGCAFTIGSQSWDNGTRIYPQCDEDGWYTISRDCSANISGRANIDPNANILYGRWTFNEKVELPADLVALKGGQMFTGSGYGTEITMIAAQAGAGVMYANEDTNDSTYVIDSNGLWVDESYRSVDFGNLGEVMSDDFYKWFITNATEGGLEYVSVKGTYKNCTTSNPATGAIKGKSYGALISTSGNYEVYSAKVTMGGEDVTKDVYSMGIISIPEVTGDIVIDVMAIEYFLLTGKYELKNTVSVRDELGNPESITIPNNNNKVIAGTGGDYSIGVVAIMVWGSLIRYTIIDEDAEEGCRSITLANANSEGIITFDNLHQIYRNLDFGEKGLKVEEEFYDWLQKNAVKQA